MISLQEIRIFPKQFCLSVFEKLFSRTDDEPNISNFLLCPYQEAYDQFDIKLKYINILDEIIFFVYDSGNNIIGYATAFPNRWNDSLLHNEIECGLFIQKEYRGQGYGSEVLKQLEQFISMNMPEIDTIALAPALTNEQAALLYERLGWDYEPNSLALSQNMIYMIKEVKRETIDTSKEGVNYLLQCNNNDLKTNYVVGHVFSKKSSKVGIFQFSQSNDFSDYSSISKHLGDINIYQFNIDNKDQVLSGWSLMERSLPAYDLIIIDGMDKLLENNFISERITEVLEDRPAYLDVLMTCRDNLEILSQKCQYFIQIRSDILDKPLS